MIAAYTCAMCKRTLQGRDDEDWSDEHARREAEENFTEVELESTEVVCDDCYRLVKPHLPAIRAEWDREAAALGITRDEVIRLEAERYRLEMASGRCYQTGSGLWVHVRPGCPHGDRSG